MAQFKQGDLREAALARYIIDEEGNIIGGAGTAGHVAIADISAVGGQTMMANSLPVVIASDQSAIEVEVSDEPVEVVGIGTTITVTPTLTVAGVYAAGDFVGTSATPMTFTGAARVAAGSGVIETAILVDGDLQSVGCELWLFDTTVTPPNDNAAWTISDANALTCIGVIPFATYYASALNSVAIAKGLNIAFNAVGGTAIYGCLVTRGAPTYVSGNLSVRLAIMQD